MCNKCHVKERWLAGGGPLHGYIQKSLSSNLSACRGLTPRVSRKAIPKLSLLVQLVRGGRYPIRVLTPSLSRTHSPNPDREREPVLDPAP